MLAPSRLRPQRSRWGVLREQGGKRERHRMPAPWMPVLRGLDRLGHLGHRVMASKKHHLKLSQYRRERVYSGRPQGWMPIKDSAAPRSGPWPHWCTAAMLTTMFHHTVSARLRVTLAPARFYFVGHPIYQCLQQYPLPTQQ